MRCAWRMCWKRCLGIRWIHAICDSVVIHAICGIEESCGFYSIFKRSIYSYIQWASFQSILTHALILNAQYINFPLFIAQFPRISIAKCIFDGSSFSKKKKHETCVDIDACIITTFKPNVSSWWWRTNTIFNKFEMKV